MVLIVAVVLSILAGFAVELHPHFEVEAISGFGLALPFGGALACALIAGLLRAVISRAEDPEDE
jgi:hypothetical protein